MGFFGGGGGGTTPVNMVGASTGTAGTAGYVPAPAAGKNTRALFSDATFQEMPWLPQYKNTGSLYKIYSLNQGSAQGQAGTAKLRIFDLIFAPSDGNVDTLCFRTHTGTISAAINVHVALWEVAEDGTPSTYVIGGNASSGTSASTDVSISVTSTPIKRGFYYISGTQDAAITGGGTIRFNSAAGFPQLNYIGKNDMGSGGARGTTFRYTATTYNQTTHETLTLSNDFTFSLGFEYV